MKIISIGQKIENINKKESLSDLTDKLGQNITMPDYKRNYILFDENFVNNFASYKEKALKPLSDYLCTSMNEKGIIESLYIVNKLVDNKTKDVNFLYYALSRFNNNQNPYIQSLLAGIYRKTQIPDGFGPLVKMLITNSQNPYKNVYFDPNEEIGGAILEYIKNYSSLNCYKK